MLSPSLCKRIRISDLGLPYPDCVTLLLRHKGGVQGVLAADVVSRKAVRSFECFGDGIHLFWEGNPKALYEFKDGDKQPVNTYASFEHDSRYSDNIVENAYVDELTNFFAVLKGTEDATLELYQGFGGHPADGQNRGGLIHAHHHRAVCGVGFHRHPPLKKPA